MSVGGVVGAIVGGVIGYFAGGNVYAGASLGYSLGSGAQALLAPPKAYGPQINDLRNQSSSYGVDIPERWGAGRQAGNVIWQTDLVENKVETSSKGGQTTVSYKYTFHTAVGVCQGPITGISRIWGNKKVLYDARADNHGLLSDPKIGTVRIYLGDETQEADPLVAAISGPDTPAYRGLAYVVLEGVDGTDTQGRIQWEFEVIADGAVSTLYQKVCALTANDPGDANAHGFSWIGGPQGTTIYWWRRSNATNLNSTYRYFRSLDGGAIEYLGSDGFDNFNISEKVAGNTTSWPCFVDAFTRMDPDLDAGIKHQPVQFSFPNGDHSARLVCNDVAFTSFTSLAGDGNLFAYDQETDVTVIAKRDPTHLRYFGLNVVAYVGGSPIYGGIPVRVLGYDDRRLGVSPIAATETICALAAVGGSTFAMIFDGTVMRLRIFSQVDGSLINDFPGPAIVPATGTDIQESIVSDGSSVWAWSDVGGVVWRWNADGSYRIIATGVRVQADDGTLADGLGGNRIFIDDQSIVIQSEAAMQSSGPPIYRIERGIFASPAKAAVPLSQIVTDLCGEAGLLPGDIDVSQLTDLVSGYTRPRNMTARAAIEPLQQAYFFEAVESDFKLKFVKRGGAIAVTIPQDDRAAHVDDEDLPDHLKIVRANELEVPSLVDVEYVDESADYLVGSQYERRLTKKVVSAGDLKLAIVLTADQAKQIAATSLYAAWLTQTYSFSTSRAYAHLEPTDVVALPTDSATYVARITKKTERASGVIDWEAVEEDANVYVQTAAGTPLSYTPTTLKTIARTDLELMDIPILRDEDDDAGAYAKATPAGDNWQGASVFRNDGGTPTTLGVVGTPSVVGVALGALPDWTGIGAFDEGNALDVHVHTGTLISVTRQQALGGANAFLVGNGIAGQEEIVVARDVTLVATKQYRLSGLLRKQKATPADLHAVSDRVVKLDKPGMVRIPGASTYLTSGVNQAARYGAVTFGRNFDGTDQQDFTNTSRGLLPLPPVHVGGGRANGDLVLKWQRRTRLAAPLRDFVDAPLGESTEQYRVDVSSQADFSTVARSFTTSFRTLTYDAASQAGDAVAGVTLYARISQLSSSVGPGTPATIAVAP